jgi:hypothetical protein
MKCVARKRKKDKMHKNYLLHLLFCVSFVSAGCISEFSSIDKLVYDSKVVIKGEITGNSNTSVLNEYWFFYDLYIKVNKVFKGDINKDSIRIRVYGNEGKNTDINGIINNKRNKVFYCFLNDTNYGQYYCNTYFKVKNDYDFVPTSYMLPISLFDFENYDNKVRNVKLTSELNEISFDKIEGYIRSKLESQANKKCNFKLVELDKKKVYSIPNLKKQFTCGEDYFFVYIDSIKPLKINDDKK